MYITADFFRNRLDQVIDLHHQLAVLSNRIRWQQIVAPATRLLNRQDREGKQIEDSDLFGATEVIAGSCVSNASRPRRPSGRL
jgi:hypothetical protein